MTRSFGVKTLYPDCPKDLRRVEANKHNHLFFRRTFNDRWVLERDWRPNSLGAWDWEALVETHGPLVEAPMVVTPGDLLRASGYTEYDHADHYLKTTFPDTWERYEQLIERIKEEGHA